MTKLRRACLFFVAFFFSVNLCFAETVRLTNGNWKPFLAEDMKHYGILSHITTEAFKSVGNDVHYGFYPWKRALDQAGRGHWDGSVAWAYLAEREKTFYHSTPIHSLEAVFFHLKDNEFDWNKESDLENILIGSLLGSSSENVLANIKASGKNITYETVQSTLQSFKMLLAGRIELALSGKEAGLYILRNSFPSEIANQITYHVKPLYSSDIHVLFNRDNGPDRVMEFNRGFKKIKENGHLRQMWHDFHQGKYDSPSP